MSVGLVWLASNYMFGSGNFWKKITLVIFENFQIAQAISKFSKTHSANLSQISVPNMQFLVLIPWLR